MSIRYRRVLASLQVKKLLDLYPAKVAYSFRKLRSTYTGPCVKIRRSSTNTEQDFYFVNDFVDTTEILSFVGAGDGFISKWYNQGSAGSTFDVAQTTHANQPSLVLSGSLNLADGHLAANFDGTNDNLVVSATLTGSGTYNPDVPFTLFAISKRTGAGVFAGIAINDPISVTTNMLQNHSSNAARAFYYNLSDALVGTATTNTSFQGGFFRASTIVAYNGVSEASVARANNSNTASNLSLGAGMRSAAVYTQGRLVEAIAYENDQYANRAAISSEMKTYYSV